MKTIVLGDIHGRECWKRILKAEADADRVVFVGDYLDPYVDMDVKTILDNLIDIIDFARNPPDGIQVDLLVGNHDFHYLPYGTMRYSRYIPYAGFGRVLTENQHLLKACVSIDDKYLISHAGISTKWYRRVAGEGLSIQDLPTLVRQVNLLWEDKPATFEFSGAEPSGDSSAVSPTWIRPYSLVQDNLDSMFEHSKIVQIFGHTQVQGIYSYHHNDLLDTGFLQKGIQKDSRYILIDCIKDEYLIIEDGVASCGKTPRN